MDNKQLPKANAASRFSRRRFIQTAASTSPILLALKSPASWGVTTSLTSISVLTSMNASDTGNQEVPPKTSAFWIKAFDGSNNTVRDLLAEQDCFFDSPLLSKVSSEHEQTMNGLQSFQKSTTPNSTWQYKLDPQTNPKMADSLENFNKSIYVLFDDDSTTVSVDKTVNIIEDVPDLLQNLASAYLNSLFYPTITYYSLDQLQTLYNNALTDSIDLILQDLETGAPFNPSDPKYSAPMQELLTELNQLGSLT